MKNLLKKLAAFVDSHLNIRYRIGMRVVKTAGAVMICLLITLFTGGWESVSIMAVSAVVTIRTTQGETMSSGLFRVIGTICGGIVGMLTFIIGLFLPYYDEGLYIVVVPLMLLLDLYLCNVLKVQDSCTISCVVTILVAVHGNFDSTVSGAFIFTLFRLRDTLVGVIVATILNIVPYYIVVYLKKKKEPDKAQDGNSDSVEEQKWRP